jgi:hypothetical protein
MQYKRYYSNQQIQKMLLDCQQMQQQIMELKTIKECEYFMLKDSYRDAANCDDARVVKKFTIVEGLIEQRMKELECY